jgi:hypothetical protein
MVGTGNNRSRRRRSGEVVNVVVNRDNERPVNVTCRDHAHRYEFAWRATDHGPVISDLRVTSSDGTPITSDSLRRINTVRLAHTAQAYDTDYAAAAGNALGAFADPLADLMSDPDGTKRVAGVLAWMESSGDEFSAEVAAAMRAGSNEADLSDLVDRVDEWWANRNHSFIPQFFVDPEVVNKHAAEAMAAHAAKRGIAVPPKRRGGRPPLTRKFLAQVADWAREASRAETPYYEYIRRRVDERDSWKPSDETIKMWIKRCKDPNDLLGTDALGKDELRRSRTVRKDG